jgi:hypothetical protein
MNIAKKQVPVTLLNRPDPLEVFFSPTETHERVTITLVAELQYIQVGPYLF